MERITVRELYRDPEKYADQTVKVAGWVRTLRDQKSFGFINLSDGSCFKLLQVVFSAEKLSNFREIARQGSGSALVVTGTVLLTPNSRQPLEIQATEITVEGESPSDYPLQPKRHSPEYLRSIAHLRPRSNLFSAVFRVRSVAAYAIHKFFNERGFLYVHTPLITSIDAEGAGEMFHVTTFNPLKAPLTEAGEIDYHEDFFAKQTHLTVTGQLNAEAFAQAFSSVYTFGPTFRAENSNTSRHAAEFWMVEPEIAFADLNDDMKLAEEMLKYIIRYVLEACHEEMQFFNQFVDKSLIERLEKVANADFAVMTYTEAIEELKDSGQEFEYKPEWGVDLQTEHERWLTEKKIGGPVFIIDYPKEIKAFYMRVNEDQKTVAAMDCLVPSVGEIIGGSQREERFDVLVQRMTELGLEIEPYQWYLDLRRYGSTKHAGFGLGFERLIMYLTSVNNIRDVSAFPRTTGSAEF